jgi:hypothetical protein
MHRYQYFVKQANAGAWFFKKLQCVRVPEGDKRIPELATLYKPIGNIVLIPYHFKPTQKEEEFQLKMNLQSWDADIEIVDAGTKEPKELV